MSRAEAIAGALLSQKVIAILRGLRWPEVEPLVRSLRDAGLRFIEITVESGSGVETLAALRGAFGDGTYLGAGSLIRPDQAEQGSCAVRQMERP